MKNAVIGFAVLFILVFSMNAQDNLSQYFYGHFVGKIGNMDAVMEFNKLDSMVNGNYYYKQIMTPIPFVIYNSAIKEGKNIHIEEDGGIDDNGDLRVTGIFSGQIQNGVFAGTWNSPTTNRTMDFSFKEDYSDAVKLKFENNKKEWGNSSYGGAKVTVECAFPQIDANIPQNIAEKINSEIKSGVKFDQGEKKQESMEDFFNALVEDFKSGEENQEAKEGEEEKAPWNASIHAVVQRNSDNILCVQYDSYTNTGGAHPFYYINDVNFDLKTGNMIKLDDVINPKKLEKVDEICEKLFRQQHNLSPTASWEEMGFSIENNQFKLNDNFVISKDALLFTFNPYEIGPYAMGAMNLTVPFKDIEKYLNDKFRK